MTHLFKKGDRVRRISGDWEGFSKGDVGEGIHGDTYGVAVLFNGKKCHGQSPQELILVDNLETIKQRGY